MVALYESNRFIVSKEQIEKAKTQYAKRRLEILQEHKSDLIMIGIGCNFETDLVGGVGNHRARALFINKDGVKCLLEVGAKSEYAGGKDYMSVNHSTYNCGEENEDYYYNDLSREYSSKKVKFTLANVLILINQEFNCNFSNIYLDKCMLHCDDIDLTKYNISINGANK